LDHRNFAQAKELIEHKNEEYFLNSVDDVDQALKALYGDREISTQQLSATFRRGDLIGRLREIVLI
ncbi:MAG: abortive phage resistance protein, partial [Chlorobium sp.]